MTTDEDRARRQAFAAEMGLYMETKGLPRIPGRVLGWLLICEPEFQSADELAAALQSSRGSISMATQMLQRAGVVERYPVAGARRTYYRLRPGFWLNEAAEKAQLAAESAKFAERGLELLADAPESSKTRLRDMRDMYSFLAEEYDRIEELWKQRQRE